MDQLTASEPAPSAAVRLGRRLRGGFSTWPSLRAWGECGSAALITLCVMAVLGFSTGLYSLHPARLAGLPLRMVTVLFIPAIGEEATFRGLLVPGRDETARPGPALVLATFIFVTWHLVEAETFLPVARALFERPDFLACAAILGAGCGWMRWRSGSIWPGVLTHWLMVTVWQTWLGGFTL